MLGRTAGEIRGKSIVWTARVFTGSPKIEEKSRKIRSPFLVPLSLLSTSPRPPSFSCSEGGALVACRTMPILFRESPNIDHFRRATIRALVPMEREELDANVIVVDDELHAEWLQLLPGQQALPLAAPRQGVSIVCCTQENGLTAGGDRMVTVWWFPMETTSQEPAAGDPWTPLRAPGPTSGADPSGIIFTIFAMLCPLLTITSRGILILIFEVCIRDCPKSWSGLLALAAARVLGITDVAALLAFLAAAERLFTEDSGIIFAAEPHLDFFVHFINAALRASVPVVVAAVHEHAAQMQMSKTAAVEYLAGQFQVEARWLAAAGAPIYEPLRWIIRKTPRPQAAFAWTQIRDLLCDHELPWPVELLLARARMVIIQGGTSFWWRGQGGEVASAAEQEQMRTLWSSRARAKLSCQNAGGVSCGGTWGNWGGMCFNCRHDPTVYARDPCVAKFEHGAGRTGCFGPNDTRGAQCVTCAGKLDKRKRPEGSARAANGGSNVRSAAQLAKCPGCGRQVKACRKAHRENRAPLGKLEICKACS
jgi:hypothetical protein